LKYAIYGDGYDNDDDVGVDEGNDRNDKMD
jgi:hypothetical protein